MQKLPIGIQTFSKIQEGNFVYIDKTKEAYELINKYQFVFLSRPRRFGKSLFVDTLQNIFEGKKDLFKGLYIHDKHNWNETYPVIKISFSDNFSDIDLLKKQILSTLALNAERLEINHQEKTYLPILFQELIHNAYKKYNQQVVILIDEYDKPLLDNITNEEKANQSRDILREIYSIIKLNDKYIKFAFLTGVSKFSKVSLFSGLNNLEDITLNPSFGNICGYTQADIEISFKNHLKDVNLNELKKWYDGYNFLKDKVYNPFDILLFIRNNKIYRNYWFETGTPTFLLKLIKEQNYYLPNLETAVVGDEILNSFDINKINIEVLLFQTGYLTIKEQRQRPRGGIEYSLVIPNKEVRISLSDVILNMFLQDTTIMSQTQDNAYLALYDANLDKFSEALKTMLSSLPYQNYTNNNIQIYEGFYASIIYTYLSSLGLPLEAESSTNKGRIDLTLELNNNIYIIEFKVGSKNALEQIKEKKYYEKFQNKEKQIYLVGINFDKDERNISKFEWERLN